MLTDLGKVSKDEIQKHKEFRCSSNRVGCISTAICSKCEHMFRDSLCLCSGDFECPNCGTQNGMNYMKLDGSNLVRLDPNLNGFKIITHEEQFVGLFNTFATEANATALSKGFDNAETDSLVQIALMHAELGEATEAYRKDLQDDHIPEFKGIEAELADTVIRIMNMAAAKKLRVAEAIIAKMAYNKTRAFRHGGKKC